MMWRGKIENNLSGTRYTVSSWRDTIWYRIHHRGFWPSKRRTCLTFFCSSLHKLYDDGIKKKLCTQFGMMYIENIFPKAWYAIRAPILELNLSISCTAKRHFIHDSYRKTIIHIHIHVIYVECASFCNKMQYDIESCLLTMWVYTFLRQYPAGIDHFWLVQFIWNHFLFLMVRNSDYSFIILSLCFEA